MTPSAPPPTTTYPTNGTTWIHVAGTYDGTTIKLYYNGVLQGSTAFARPIATNNLAIGIGGTADAGHDPPVQGRDG